MVSIKPRPNNKHTGNVIYMPSGVPSLEQNKYWMQNISRTHPIAKLFDKNIAFEELKKALILFAWLVNTAIRISIKAKGKEILEMAWYHSFRVSLEAIGSVLYGQAKKRFAVRISPADDKRNGPKNFDW